MFTYQSIKNARTLRKQVQNIHSLSTNPRTLRPIFCITGLAKSMYVKYSPACMFCLCHEFCRAKFCLPGSSFSFCSLSSSNMTNVRVRTLFNQFTNHPTNHSSALYCTPDKGLCEHIGLLLLLRWCSSSMSLYVHRDRGGLLGTGSRGRPPRLSHSSWALVQWCL